MGEKVGDPRVTQRGSGGSVGVGRVGHPEENKERVDTDDSFRLWGCGNERPTYTRSGSKSVSSGIDDAYLIIRLFRDPRSQPVN